MKKVLNLLAVLIFTCAFASLAQAQATRTWVSGVGDDANPCSRTAPCKTFAGAESKTADCGEIDALDPGGFGAVTIVKSLTLDGTGTLAGILASGTTGIIVNGLNAVVTIRGLSINGACTGIRGINFIQGIKLNVEDCVIFRFVNEGILINNGTNVALNVRNSVIRDNAGDGIATTTSSGTVKTTLDNVRSSGNGTGVHAKSNSKLTARNCVFSNNTGNGVFVDGTTALSVAHIWASQVSLNGSNGFLAGGAGPSPSGLTIAQNMIDRNTGFGVTSGTGGAIATFGNNSIIGNGTDTCAGCAPVGPGQ